MKTIDQVGAGEMRRGFCACAPLPGWRVDGVTRLARVPSRPLAQRWLEPAAGKPR